MEERVLKVLIDIAENGLADKNNRIEACKLILDNSKKNKGIDNSANETIIKRFINGSTEITNKYL